MNPTHILFIALTTFRESIRSKILFSIFFLLIATIVTSAWFGSVTVGGEVAVVKHFGLTGVSLATVLYCVIAGASLLAKELARKTIYNILAKPVSRLDFLVGKFLGLTTMGTVMVALMGVTVVAYSWYVEGKLDLNLLQPLVFMVFELAIVSSLVILFSSVVVTPVLNGLFSFGVFFAGRSSDYVLKFADQMDLSSAKAIYWCLPHLQKFYTGDEAARGLLRSWSNIGASFLYALSFCALALLLAQLVFRRRHFN